MRLTRDSEAKAANFFRLDTKDKQSLVESGTTLAAQYGATSAVIDKCLTDLLRYYDARGRYYHNSSHLAALLRWCERYQNELREPAVIKFAIWFHDVIYRTRRHDNEPRSADYATTTLAQLNVPLAVIDDVASLIRATQTHRLDAPEDALPERLHHDGGWFLDFDLAILGSNPDVYAAYAKAIRREYFWVPTFLFRQKRRAVLENFLQRPQLFFTAIMRAELETQARANLTNELAELK